MRTPLEGPQAVPFEGGGTVFKRLRKARRRRRLDVELEEADRMDSRRRNRPGLDRKNSADKQAAAALGRARGRQIVSIDPEMAAILFGAPVI